MSDWIASQYPPDSQFIPEGEEHFARVAARETGGGARYLPDRLIRGHFRLADALRYARSVDDEPRFFFTLLRRPEAQMMSFLWHKVSQDLNLVEGRNHPAVEVDKYLDLYVRAAGDFAVTGEGVQRRYFCFEGDRQSDYCGGGPQGACDSGRCGQRGLADVHVVGVNERFVDSLRILAWRMGWAAPRNIGHARATGAGQRAMPRELKDILRECLASDQAFYAAARQRFDADYAKLCTAAGGPDAIDDWLDAEAPAGVFRG